MSLRLKINYFLKKQRADLRKGKWLSFLRKCRTLILILPALFAVFIIRIIRPFVLIRFAPLNSDRIGSFTGYIDLYLCERDLGMHNSKALDIFYYTFPICNQQLKKMLSPYLRILNFPNLANQIYKINNFLPGGRRHQALFPWTVRDVDNLRVRAPIHLIFTPQEESFGAAEKRRIGIPDNASLICFKTRDPAYLNSAHPGNDFSYLDFRNASIYDLILAAEELTRRGYFMVRMGAKIQEKLDTNNSLIIDYASKYRTDFLDIYFPAKCRFFLCVSTGLAEIAQIFRKPIAYVNFIPLELIPSWNKYDLIIPKKLWLKKENRFLTFREILNSAIGQFFETRLYGESGIEIINNTPEEIIDLAVEMDERLKGTWVTTDEDEELQRRFWNLFKNSPLHGKINARMGRDFLRQNKELIAG